MEPTFKQKFGHMFDLHSANIWTAWENVWRDVLSAKYISRRHRCAALCFCWLINSTFVPKASFHAVQDLHVRVWPKLGVRAGTFHSSLRQPLRYFWRLLSHTAIFASSNSSVWAQNFWFPKYSNANTRFRYVFRSYPFISSLLSPLLRCYSNMIHWTCIAHVTIYLQSACWFPRLIGGYLSRGLLRSDPPKWRIRKVAGRYCRDALFGKCRENVL